MNEIAQYYEFKYGAPERQAKFASREGHAIEIFKWNENQTGEGVAMYATLGASTVLGDENCGCEFFIGLTPPADDVAHALAEVAIDGNGTDGVPASGDTIKLAFPLWHGTLASCFMFTDGDELLLPMHAGGKKIVFIQLVPLFDSELEFKIKQGEASLWQHFEEKNVPYWDSTRKKAF